jgi:diguanylate cyclase (GGDEF)-like protein
MTQTFGDAREEELRFLLEVERVHPAGVLLRPEMENMARREMIAWLLAEHLFFGPGDQVGSSHAHANPFDKSRDVAFTAMKMLANGQAVDNVRLSHKGRLRISELRESLRSGRIRDATGIVFDGRHADRALRVAVIEATRDRPLAIAFLDLNGMKQANDSLGHAAGDVLVRAYLNAVDAAIEDKGEAFRIGGDEVLVLLPAHNLAVGIEVVHGVYRLFTSERLTFGNKPLPPRAFCAGLVMVVDPSEDPSKVRARADAQMYRAKDESKTSRTKTTSPSLLAVEGDEQIVSLDGPKESAGERRRVRTGRRRDPKR